MMIDYDDDDDDHEVNVHCCYVWSSAVHCAMELIVEIFVWSEHIVLFLIKAYYCVKLIQESAM